MGGVELLKVGQSIILLGLGMLGLVVEAYALYDCVKRPKAIFEITSNQTKAIWIAILAVAIAISLVSFGSFHSLGILNIIGVSASLVYLFRVKPAIDQAGGGGSGTHGGYRGGW